MQPQDFTIFLRKVAKLSIGNVGSLILSLLTTLIVARAIGPSDYGKLALITTYATILQKFCSFQTWQPIIFFGQEFLNIKATDRFRALTIYLALLDNGCGLISFLLGTSLVWTIAAFMEWDNNFIVLVLTYLVGNLFSSTSWAIGLLRTKNEYKLLAYHASCSAFIRLSAAALLVFFTCPLKGYVIAWAVSVILPNVWIQIKAYNSLRTPISQLIYDVKVNADLVRNKEILRALSVGYWDGVLRIARDLDVFLIDRILSSHDVGIYRIGKQLVGVVSRFVDPFFQISYPDLAQLNASAKFKDARILISRIVLVLFSFATAILFLHLVVGHALIYTFLGEKFSNSDLFNVIAICLLGQITWGVAQSFSSLLMSSGKFLLLFKIHLVLIIVYLLGMPIMTSSWGVIGTSFSYTLFQIGWLIPNLFFGIQVLRNVK